MTELEKYELVNSCESPRQLEEAIVAIALSSPDGKITGNSRIHDGQLMSTFVLAVINDGCAASYLTKKYGIRQQALYLKHYNNK